MNEVEVEFVVDAGGSEEVVQLLAESGAGDVEQVEEAGLVGLDDILIATVIAVSILVDVVIKLRRAWKSGVIVDGRTGVIRTHKNPDLPAGTVLVFTPDGVQHTLHEPAHHDLEPFIKSMSSG